MNNKLLVGIAISIIICSTVLFEQVSSDALTQPSKLKIYVGPTSVPADDNTYNCIFVQLQDSNGNPARAVHDTTISLSSSVTNIGTVDPSITISTGSTYGTANFYSTFTPGTTTIAATATGYATVQASVTTVGPNPTQISVYGFPSILPAGEDSYNALLVQLQDSSGSPAKAPKGGIQITLSSSNVNVGDVTPSVTISEGQTYTTATFTTNGAVGQAIITPVSSGYVSKQTTITTRDIMEPTQLKIFTGSTKVLAEKNAYNHIAIQLQDDEGNVAVASSDIIVTLSSSDQTIGTTETQITIPQSKTYALATLNTTYKAGTTTITAAATNLTAAQQTISTIGFTPSTLAVYCVPATLPADSSSYEIIQVQLQDSQGHPAKDPVANVTVSLFSSQPEIGEVSSTLTIPFGKTHATGEFTVTNAPGSSSVTAQASSYTTGQGTITTYTIDFSTLDVELTAPECVLNGNKTEITAYVSVEGTPVTEPTVKFTSNNGGKFTTPETEEPGVYKTTFTAPSFSKITNCTITVSAAKTGFISSQATVQIAVGPTLATDSTNNSKGTLQLCIQDDNGNYLSDVMITSTIQPDGMKALSGITNETGCVTFKNAVLGSYNLSLTKGGYEATNQTINFGGSPSPMTLVLLGNAQSDNTPLLIIVGVVIAVIIVVISIILIKRRRADDGLQDYNKYFKS